MRGIGHDGNRASGLQVNFEAYPPAIRHIDQHARNFGKNPEYKRFGQRADVLAIGFLAHQDGSCGSNLR